MGIVRPNFIVGIGGSAGALNAYKAFLDNIPAKTGMAFVIISHMNPTASSELAQILSRHTKMKVIVAANGLPIQRNHLYVIPPNADLFIEKYNFKVVSPRAQRNNQIDLFLTSLAEAMGARAISIILSGYDGDGSAGSRQIKSNGGITFAQDDSAEIIHMPLSALHTGCIDFVMSPDKMSVELQRLSTKLNDGPS